MTTKGQHRMVSPEDQETLKRIDESAELADRAFRRFREQQTDYGMQANQYSATKSDLQTRLAALRTELDRYLATEYGIDMRKPVDFARWRSSHQPFHWFVEFYGIMQKGGFNVIIGNPPYVAAVKVRRQYDIKNLLSLSCPDIYAWVLERNQTLLRTQGRTGMIVPLSLGFSNDFAPIRDVLYKSYRSNWFLSFGRIPSALFNFDVRVRNIIHIGLKDGTGGVGCQ